MENNLENKTTEEEIVNEEIDNSLDLENIEEENLDEETDEEGNKIKKEQHNDFLSEDLLNDLESVNDDFAIEIQAQKDKEKEASMKKLGIEEEKEEEMELKPLEASEGNLEELINLNGENITEFIKENAKEGNIPVEEEKKEEKEENSIQNPAIANLFATFKLNDDLWDELKLSNEAKEKIQKRVKLEIKLFIKENLFPLLEQMIK